MVEVEGNSMFALIIVFLASIIFFFFYYYCYYYYGYDQHHSKNVPPGSLGLPVIGESWSFVKAQREDKGNEWIEKRVAMHGTVFKTSLMGCPTVIVTGRAGNKFVFSADDETLSVKQPPAVVMLVGKCNMLELTGPRYKLVKSVVMRFLKPEAIQEYIEPMDSILKNTVNSLKVKDSVLIVPLMKRLTFNITCSLLFGLHDEPTNDALFEDFSHLFKGLWSVPLNLPGTAFRQALRARSNIVRRVTPILKCRREKINEGVVNANSDMLSGLVTKLSDEEIIDNFVALMVASHDTTAILLTLMVWKLARDPHVYQKVSQEQRAIIRERHEKPNGELTWSEIQRMKYTWRVAQEIMRMIPPVFGNFRKAMKDISFAGYDIPKGWQVFWEVTQTHMNNEIFEKAASFDPSRFENLSRSIQTFTYIPFGAGLRMCVGNEFARVEVLTVMHHLVTNFEWFQLIPDEPITRNPMPYPSKGLPIKLKETLDMLEFS
ncbi:putative taxane 13-alpha-hydroxylase [Dioscorea sansibarensis]